MTSERINSRLATVELRILSTVITKMAARAAEEKLREHGFPLGHLQYGVLDMVGREHMTLKDISQRFGRSSSTLVPVVDALEERGYLVRERDPEDRRRVQLRVTQMGQDLLDRMPALVLEDDPLHVAVCALTEDHMAQMLAALRVVVRGLPEGERYMTEISRRLAMYADELTTTED